MKAKILIVDDEEELCRAICKKLETDGYTVDYVLSGEAALERLQEGGIDLVILDYKMPGMDGFETLKHIKKNYENLPVIFITAFGDSKLAMESLELGADEFVNKPFNLKNLSFRVYKTLKLNYLEEEIQTLKKETDRSSFSSLIWHSPQMEKILSQIDIIARHNAPVLISGETGTGKELVAAALHNNTFNPRKEKPFLSINCAAVPEPLIESEIFGHARGAFSGAVTNKKGLFEVADGGTLFLDEIISASVALQAKLLRVLDSGEYYKVGETVPRNTDVRIIAATNKDLTIEVAREHFREDLYHRLRVVEINLPALRERKTDIEPLTNFFIKMYNAQAGKKVKFQKKTIEAFESFSWPGNVRELKHVVQSLVLLAERDTITPAELPERITNANLYNTGQIGSFSDLKTKALERFEKEYFVNLVKSTRGNVSRAARIADLSRTHVIKKLKDYDISPTDFK